MFSLSRARALSLSLSRSLTLILRFCIVTGAPTTFQYVRISHPTGTINLEEVKAFTSSGVLMKAASAILSSTEASLFPAVKCIDGALGRSSMCHSKDGGASLVIKYSSAVRIGSILVHNRLDDGGRFQSRIVGATISLAEDKEGKVVVWAGKFDTSKQEYRFNLPDSSTGATTTAAKLLITHKATGREDCKGRTRLVRRRRPFAMCLRHDACG